MNSIQMLLFFAIGALAGWLAGKIYKGSRFGLVGNIIIGVIGSVLGGFIFSIIGIQFYGIAGSVICATLGAVLLVFIVNKIKR